MTEFLPHPDVSPRELARTYDRLIAARWRGEDETADSCSAWFEAHWTVQAPPEPDEPPGAASVLGGSGTGIRWYERDSVVLGYVTGRPGGCYWVTVGEMVPALEEPWEIADPQLAALDSMLHSSGM